MGSSSQSGIALVGSANMDTVFSVERIPLPGETLLARSVAKYPGGKGLNQGVACARSGAHTTFIGALGNDENGAELSSTMSDAGIDATLVRKVPTATGQAFIMVADSAENSIVVASGANDELTSLTDAEREVVAGSAVILMQLESPLDVVVEAALVARAAGTTVMVNAAPARELPDELIDAIDYLIVNEHEACLLGGTDDLAEASARLAKRVEHLIVTLGGEGSAIYEHGSEVARIPARNVTAVDTTGAGDTFCGAFAAAISQGQSVADAATFATAAAALSVQVLGAVPSIPTRDQIVAMMAEPA